jgi:putative chitinase
MEKALELSKKYKSLLNRNNINTPLRLSHFFAQIAHESGGFKYLRELGSNDYLDKYDTGSLAKSLGNTPEDDDDGQKYCGRGYIMITGLANYKELSRDTDIDFITYPELLEQEVNAMIASLWFWTKRNLNIYADKDDIKSITKRINGGYNGLKERQIYLDKYKKIFK